MSDRKGSSMNYSLCMEDTIKSVLQNVALIVSTIKGTVTMYREFGIRGTFIDKPPHAAKVLLTSEIKEAIEEFEPRATVQDISFIQGGDPAKMNVNIKLLIRSEVISIDASVNGRALTILTTKRLGTVR